MARRDGVVQWIEDVLEGRKPESDYDSALGRLSFVCGAIRYDRPFLAPLYNLAAATRKKFGTKVNVQRLPGFIKLVLLQLKLRLLARKEISCKSGRPPVGHSIERFRSDAKAEGEDICVGGYQTHDALGSPICNKEALCFQLRLDRKNAPMGRRAGGAFPCHRELGTIGDPYVSHVLGGKDGRGNWTRAERGAISRSDYR